MARLDTIRTAETPEGVELKLTCAGFYARSIAWLLDVLIQAGMLILLLLVLPKLGEFGQGLMYISLFFLHWLYPVIFEMTMQGQTPGKRKMNLQVLMIDGTTLNWGASLLRNLLRTVDFLPFLYALGVLSMLLSKDFRRLGDLAANTIVVYRRQQKEQQAIIKVEPLAPKIALSAREQQTIVHYAERLQKFSPERAEELASIAAPFFVADNQIAKSSRDQILSLANYLVGRR